LAAEATPSKLQRNRSLARGRVAIAAASMVASAAASEAEAVASGEASEVIEEALGVTAVASVVIEEALEEVSEATEVDLVATEVGMAEEVESVTKAVTVVVTEAVTVAVIVEALAADHLLAHLADLVVQEAAMMTKEMDTVVVGMAEAVTVGRLAVTEIPLALAAAEIDTTTGTGMAAVDETMTMALESDTTTGIPTTIQGPSADTRDIRDKVGITARHKSSPIVLVLQPSITVC